MRRLRLVLLVAGSVLSAPCLQAAKAVEDTSAAAPSTPDPDTQVLRYKDRLVRSLVSRVPELLETFDAQTGHFGSGIWICTDQNLMYPLAAAWGCQHPDNPYHKDPRLLEVLIKAGDALIDDADETGQWVFRKKDGSTWGKIWMPWTYSRWIRTFAMIRPDMPAGPAQRWTEALTLGYTGIAAKALGHVHNIPAHHAMGLYIAGRTLDRPEWCRQAAEFLTKVTDQQADGGYWSENVGPVVNYNFVYLDALGTYYALSRDGRALAAIEKGVRFHYHFRYPDGSRVETIDERNPYKPGVDVGNVAFTFTPLGRAYLAEQWDRHGIDKLPVDLIASLLLYGQEGQMADMASSRGQSTFVLQDGGQDRAAVVRHGPWFVCLSAYTADIPRNRWIQDRQNLVSVYHDKTGLILGGGNTKLQPAWSSFTVGDTSLLAHKPGDTQPDFVPKGELYHVPSRASLLGADRMGLELVYGPATCRIRLRPIDDRCLEYSVESTGAGRLPAAAHLTLIRHPGQTLRTGAGHETKLDDTAIDWAPADLGGSVSHAGWRVVLPDTASLHWPALPHNPYRKDGRATVEEGRIEIRIPLPDDGTRHIRLEIEKD